MSRASPREPTAVELRAASQLAGFIDLFAPIPQAPDYELTLDTQESGQRFVTTLRHHGDWVRIDKAYEGRRSTQYVHTPTQTAIEVAENAPAMIRALEIHAADRRDDRGVVHLSFKTGEQRNVAGEACAVWDVYHGLEFGKPTFRRFGCVTPDGIELVRWTVSSSGTELGPPQSAIKLMRRKVAASEVEPPASTFDLSRWIGDPPAVVGAYKPAADFDVVLASGVQSWTVRRHGGWRYEERRASDGSLTYTSRNEAAGRFVLAQIDPGGRPIRFEVREAKMSPDVAQPLPETLEDASVDKCNWFNLTPGMADYGILECRTPDGMPLRIIEQIWGSQVRFDALRDSRRQLRLDHVLPPHRLIEPATWGIRR